MSNLVPLQAVQLRVPLFLKDTNLGNRLNLADKRPQPLKLTYVRDLREIWIDYGSKTYIVFPEGIDGIMPLNSDDAKEVVPAFLARTPDEILAEIPKDRVSIIPQDIPETYEEVQDAIVALPALEPVPGLIVPQPKSAQVEHPHQNPPKRKTGYIKS
jgi:hypothetical protein